VSIVAVTRLAKEARIAKRASLVPVIGGGDAPRLMQRLEAAAPGAKAVVSFGIAGALAPLLKTGDPVVAIHVVTETEHFACDTQWSQIMLAKLGRARSASIVGVDAVVTHLAMKKSLFRITGCHVVDMESHIAARFAKERGLPFVALRVVADSSNHTPPPAALEPLKPSGRRRITAVLKSLALDPSQIPEMIQTKHETDVAFRALIRCRRILGIGLGCPYLDSVNP
jgi:adenosylhomocysteine nucleosidase